MDNTEEITRNSLNWEDFFGSSLELAPSLLNLFDHRIATGEKDKDITDDHINDKKVSKTPSLPSQPVQDNFDEVQYRSERFQFHKLPAERPVSMMDRELTTPKGSLALFDNKKRPLSISSVSSASLTSSPQLRKKRSNTLSGDNSDNIRGGRQDSDCTLIPDCRPDTRVMSSSESRQSVDSGCVEGEKNGDRYPDSVSVTSSDTGSCKDDTDTSAKECSLVLLSPAVNKLNSAPLLRHARGTDACSPLSASPTDHKNNGTSVDCTRIPDSSNPNRYAKYFASLEQTKELNSPSEIHSFDINLQRSGLNTSESPASTCTSQNSSSRQEARMKFFANYEDYTRQSFPLPISIAEEKSELSSSPLATSLNDTPSVPQPSSQASSPAAITEADNHQASPAHIPFHKNPPSPTSPVLKPEFRRDRPSQLSPTSEKASRRSERLGSVSKHERRSTSPRSGFSRVSKKKDSHATSEPGSKSSPVYVSYVSRVVTEIIESERVYIASLKDIIQGYLEPMEKLLDSEDAKKDIACLFSNIRDIYTFGCTFLSDLEAACADPVKVAQCFVKYNKGFVIYTDYCTNYPRAVAVLTRFMQHPALSKLCKERQHSLGHALPLGAYLLKPVQRILKYHLLLHNIVKNCEKEQEEAAILEKAFHHMTQMAHHINEMKRKHEHAVRIQEIQSQLEDYVGEDLTRLGELVLEGSFKVNGAKASRQVFLFEKGLLISKLKEGGMLSCKTFIPCSNLMLIEVIPNDPLSFHIIPFDNPRAQDTLQARNMEQKRRWCHDIKKQILESFKGRIPDSAKNLIMQLGKDLDDDYLSRDSFDAGKRNQHNAPEYLEKRRFRRKSGSRLPDFSLLILQKTKKGGNKKNEIWSEEKRLPRRSESRSPERHRHIFSKQNSAAKSRSRSISSSSISLPTSSCNHLPDQTATELKYATTKPVSKTDKNSSPKSACPSPESPVYRKSPKKLIYSKDGMDAIETEDDILKRPVSFLMAKANSILSDDITNLLTRCGGNLNILNSPSLVNEQYGDLPGISKLGLKNSYDNPEELDNNDNKKVHSSEAIVSEPLSEVVSSAPCSETFKHISSLSEKIASSQKNVKESEQLKSRLISSLDPRNTASTNSSDKTKGEHKEGDKLKRNHDLHDLENVYENLLMTEGHVSRRDTLNSPNLRQKCKSEVTIDNEMERWRKEYGMMAPGVICKKNAGENILLKKKGLRLPNTSKLLSARENELNVLKNKIRHKMTSSEETLNTGCVRDMNESPLFIKSAHSSSKLPLSVASRPCGNSDLAEYMQVSVNKGSNHLLHKNRSHPLHQCSDRKEDLANEMKYLSQISYATPPRDYMTVEKMKRAGSLKDTSRPGFLSQNVGDNFFSHTTSGAVSALSISPVAVTVAKPVSFNTSNLLRSKSTPISSEIECSVAKMSPKERPVSMDVDKLTEESNKLIAEMEEYISNSCENVKSMNKFPTSLSAISAEEEEPCSNRLSMVSTISTSSYESQGSNSSDGLVGTLKSKLRAWARMRNDSEYSYPSAVTSDEEEQEQTHSESSSALELHAKNVSSWRDDSDYDTALLEDTYSEPVPYMEQPPISLATEKIVSSKREESSERESYLHRGSAIIDSYTCEDSSFVQPHSCDDPSYNEYPCDNLSITGSCSCGGFICESHPHEDASTAELHPCEDDEIVSQLHEDASIAELQPCEDDDESQQYEYSLSESHPCITETHSYRDFVSESHPCEDSSITQLQPCEDYVSDSQLCDNSLSESQPYEGSSVGRLYPRDNSSICESHQQKSINFDGVDVASKKLKTLSLKTERQPEQIQFCLSTSEAIQIPSSSANNSDIVQFCDSNLYVQCNQLSTHNSCSSNIKTVPENEHLLEESSTVKGAPAEHLTEIVRIVKENSFFGTSDYHEQCVSDKDYGDKETPTEGSLESESKIFENVDNNEQEDVDIEYPKRSIREFVQNFEEKQRAESQKVLEVKRREPGVMIRQRLKSLRESTLHGWRNSSPANEQHQLEHCNPPPPTHLSEISNGKNNDQRDTTLLDPRDNLSKSVADLCKSQENIHLSGTCLNSQPSISYYRHSIPFCNMISTNQSHGNDICEFHYNTSENQASSGNQFIHRVHSGPHQSVSRVHSSLEPPVMPWTQNGLEASVSLPEILSSMAPIEAASMQSSNPASAFDSDDSDEENLVKMKGWVKALISKFQDKD